MVGGTALNIRHALFALLASAGAVLGGPGASATVMGGDVVTGTITSLNGQVININGHTYPIAGASAAAAAASKLSPGQVVDVQLDGPASSSGSRAINIVLRKGS
jgi:hypothetical protein